MGAFTALFHFGPYIALAVTLLAGWGLWEEHKADQGKIVSQQAVIDQNNKDKIESAKQIATLATKLENIDARVQPIIQRIVSAPTTSGCGPVVGVAVDGVRDLYGGGGQVPAGPQPNKSSPVPSAPRSAGKSH